MRLATWTQASEEVQKCFSEQEVVKTTVDYIESENKKRWTLLAADKQEFVFEQFFDMNFFKHS